MAVVVMVMMMVVMMMVVVVMMVVMMVHHGGCYIGEAAIVVHHGGGISSIWLYTCTTLYVCIQSDLTRVTYRYEPVYVPSLSHTAHRTPPPPHPR